MGGLGVEEEKEGGVGGVEGMKREGMQATVAMMLMYSTVEGMLPRRGLMSWASCGFC